MSYYATKQPATISERRSHYPFHERLIVYNTESMQKIFESKNCSAIETTTSPTAAPSKSQSFMVNGVNILNKNSVDSDTAMCRIIQRRKTHNRVERRRRDRMNNLFSELSHTLPSLQRDNTNSNRADILREAIDYVKLLQLENSRLKGNVKMRHLPEDDDLSSLSSFGSSDCSKSTSSSLSPTNSALNFSFSATDQIPIPLIQESKRQKGSFRPQSQYESIIVFD